MPVERLIAKDYAAARRALIDRKRAAPAPTHGAATAGAGDTVYLAAADAAGNMVSLIQSNYMGFGSGVTVVPFGFGLQNRGSQFALDPQHANAYAPGKRPFHTIIPAFAIRAGEALLAFGVMGAAMQPQGQVQVLSNMIDFGMGLQAAGDAPRVRHEGSTRADGPARARGRRHRASRARLRGRCDRRLARARPPHRARGGQRPARSAAIKRSSATCGAASTAARPSRARTVTQRVSEPPPPREWLRTKPECRKETAPVGAEGGELVGRSGRAAVNRWGGCDSSDNRDRPCPLPY